MFQKLSGSGKAKAVKIPKAEGERSAFAVFNDGRGAAGASSQYEDAPEIDFAISGSMVEDQPITHLDRAIAKKNEVKINIFWYV